MRMRLLIPAARIVEVGDLPDILDNVSRETLIYCSVSSMVNALE